MVNFCFVCNIPITTEKHISTYYLFAETSTFHSGNKLHEVLSEILDKDVVKGFVHSNLVCQQCFQSCSVYDATKMRLQSMKLDISSRFKTSLKQKNINYDTYGSDVKVIENDNVNNNVKILPKKVVLPASKLQPLPPDYLLKFNTITRKFISNMDKNLSITTVNSNVPTIINKTVEPITQSVAAANKLPNKIDQYYKIPNGSNIRMLRFQDEEITDDVTRDDDDDEHNVDDDSDTLRIIDQDCAISVIPVTSSNGELVLEVQGFQSKTKTQNSELVNVEMIQSIDDDKSIDKQKNNKYIFGKLQIVTNEDDDNEETIVFYEDADISLMGDDDVSNHHDGDSQESNDESQIELQVSGDEETANAIIAAAQEQGGAFIKVENGEMYRVESVHSKIDDHDDEIVVEEQQPLNMVTRHDDDTFRCLLCENSIKNGNKSKPYTASSESMMSHLKKEHDARLYICSICGIFLRKRSEYATHLVNKHNEPKTSNDEDSTASVGVSKTAGAGPGRGRMHVCGVCGRKYNSRTLLSEHMNKHSGIRPHMCAHCDKSFSSKYTLQAHIKTHSDRPRPFKCKKCGKSFLTPQNLSQHEKTHSGIKDFVCGVCDKAFSTQHNLEVHGIVHTKIKAYKCPHCSKAFARAAELRDHCRIHTGERPHKCDMCDSSFTQRSNLHSHKKAKHFGEKPHHCTMCEKRFKRRRLLNYHIKAVHTGERPLECNVCKATFVYPEHYKKHIRIHNGEKPHVCEICGKKFASADNRNTHRFVHSDKKPYECLACGAGFMRKTQLYAHMKSSGHLAESIVVNQPRVAKTNDLNGTIINVEDIDEKNFDAILFPASNHLGFDTNKMDCENSTSLDNENNKEMLLQDNDMEHVETDPIITNDGSSELVRLIQIKLPDGNNRWMALNN